MTRNAQRDPLILRLREQNNLFTTNVHVSMSSVRESFNDPWVLKRVYYFGFPVVGRRQEFRGRSLIIFRLVSLGKGLQTVTYSLSTPATGVPQQLRPSGPKEYVSMIMATNGSN